MVGSSNSPRVNLNVYAWVWDTKISQEDNRNSMIFVNKNRDVMFHPSYSSGTVAVRGDTPFISGNDYYWEIEVLTPLYGTDIMIGVGTAKVGLTDKKHTFCSLLGLDQESWGYSYHGTIQHNGKWQNYGPGFNRTSTIGMHLNMWNGTLSCFVDGKPLGVAFPSLKGHVLYPMVCSTAANSAVRLLYSYSCASSLQQLCLRTLSTSNRMMQLVSSIPGLRGHVDKTFLTYETSFETDLPVQPESRQEADLNETNYVVVDNDEECIGEQGHSRRRKRKYAINVQRICSSSTIECTSNLNDCGTERGCIQCGASLRPIAHMMHNGMIVLPSITNRNSLCLVCDVIL